MLLQGLTFDVVPSTFEENLDKRDYPLAADYVIANAHFKALDVAEKLKVPTHEDCSLENSKFHKD